MSEVSPVQRERRLIVRAGLFVAGGLGLAMVVIFLIGKERLLFDRHVRYRAAFEDVEGLKLDSPVRLGGLDVGRIESIRFSSDPADKRIEVLLLVSVRFADRIRGDSVARIGSRGVLGDKVIDISIGSRDSPKIPEDGEIRSGTSGDLTSLLRTGGEVLDNVAAVSRDLKQAVAAYSAPALRTDVAGAVKSLRAILEGIESGDGVLHALIYDADTKREARRFLAAAARDAERLDGAIAQVEQILKDARTGQGSLHALLYEKEGAKAIYELGAAAGELAILLRDGRKSPNSAIHQLVYGDARDLFGNLGGAAADIKSITAKIRAGDGTLGALINDPTVYEDLKSVLGNVKRNFILRELVRYSISHRSEVEGVGKREEKK